MEQNETSLPARIEYPKPSYEQLETKLGFIARKSNRRRAALRQAHDAHLVLKYHYSKLYEDYNNLRNEYADLEAEYEDAENELENTVYKPWYKFWA